MRHAFWSRAFACVALLAVTFTAAAQISRGHEILLHHGLQLQTWAFPGVHGHFTMENWEASNLTTPIFIDGAGRGDQFLGPPPGRPWGLAGWQETPTPGELPYLENMITYQFGDEQNVSNAGVRAQFKAIIDYWHANHPNVIVFTNQFGRQIADQHLRTYMAETNPDMLMFDDYVFHGTAPHFGNLPGGSPTRLYTELEKYRVLGLEGNDGTGRLPIPVGLHVQSFVDPQFTTGHHITESEFRLNMFAAWAFGVKLTSAFIYDNPGPLGSALGTILFHGPGDTNPTPFFNVFAEVNRESRNLGPALIRLLSTDVRIASGRYRRPNEEEIRAIPLPNRLRAWAQDADPYLKTITAENLGTENHGLEGDVVVGFFRVLDESFDGLASNQRYFMIVNGLSSLHASGTAANTRQRIRMTFDFGASSITALQRMSRETGLVERVPLTHEGGSIYTLDLELDGGTGDLFKYETGARFVGDPQYGGAVAIEGPTVRFEGQRIVLSVEPGHTGYVWHHNGQPLSDGGRFSGASTATLVIDPAEGADTGTYQCFFDHPEMEGVQMRTSFLTLVVWPEHETPAATAATMAALALALGGAAAWLLRRRRRAY